LNAQSPLPDFVGEARRIVAKAEKASITLRLMGATAVRLHCPKYTDLHRALGRELTDLDFMGYSKDLKKVRELFERLQYRQRRMGYAIAVSAHGERLIFDDTVNQRALDVFFDQLRMCHTIRFKGRLEKDKPTIPLADIVLEKLQIVRLNEKDVKDCVVLLLEHDVGDSEDETVNARYIEKLLSDDWGFYYTVTTNLRKITELLGAYAELSQEDRNNISSKIERLLSGIESEPKSLKWKGRARIGTSKKWYEDVGEAVRTQL